MGDWYRIPRSAVLVEGGGKLFKYHSSLEAMLRAVYPDFNWQSHKFDEAGRRPPPGYYAKIIHQRELLERIGEELGVKQVRYHYR